MRQKLIAFTSSGFFRRAALLAVCLAAGAQATTYTINNYGMGLSDQDGVCNFREAIEANNAGMAKWNCPTPSGSTVIILAAGTYTTPAALSLTRSADIRCPSGTCIIDAGNINADLFTLSGANTFSMYKLTLRLSSGNTNSVSGLVVLGGTLRLEESVVTGFRTVGVSLRAGGGRHKILRSTLSYNGYGLSLWDGIELDMQSNTISNNWMGIQSAHAFFTDNGSVISNNTDAGVWLGDFANVYWEKTTIRGNRNRGVYIDHGCEVVLFYCTIEKNTTSSNGGGIYVGAQLNVPGSSAHVTITSSTISNNNAAGNGGGIYVTGALTLKNVTLSTNTATRGGGAYYEQYTGQSYLDFQQSTVTANLAIQSGGGLTSITNYETFHTVGCIVAQNFTKDQYPDVSGNITSRETLYGNVTGFTGSHDRDTYPANPLLGPLMDNAGPIRVQTHALLKGSPAIDKGTEMTSNLVDARGLPRPASGTWDLGAYEVAPFETELLTVIGKSSDSHVIQSSASLSNSAGTVLSANAVGDYVIYAVAVPEPGTYTISVGTLSGPNRAIVELATAPGTDQFTTIGSFDMFKPNEQPGAYGLSFPFTSASIKYFRLKVTGRNALNTTGYKCFFDYIRISKQ